MSQVLAPYITTIIDLIISPLVQLMFFAAFIVFAWGILVMILNASDESKRSEGKKHMMYAIIGMLIMIGAAGIFQLFESTIFGVAGVPNQPSLIKPR